MRHLPYLKVARSFPVTAQCRARCLNDVGWGRVEAGDEADHLLAGKGTDIET
jgi:hypothetical protein